MSSPRLRAFAIAMCGVAIGIAVSRFSGASLAAIVAVVLGLLTFVVLQMRRGR